MVKTNKINYPYYIAGTLAVLTLLASGVFVVAPYIGLLAPIVALNLSLPLIAVCAVLSSVIIALSYKAVSKNKAISTKETPLTDKTKELDNKVKESQAKVAELDQKVEEQNHTISEKDARLAEKTEEIGILNRSVSEKETLLAEKEKLSQKKQQRDIGVQADSGGLEELKEQSKQKEQELKDFNLKVDRLKSELSKKEKSIQELSSEVNKVQSEKQKLSAISSKEIGSKKAELEKLQVESSDLKKQLSGLEEDLKQKQEQITHLQEQIKDRDQKAHALEQIVDNQRRAIQENDLKVNDLVKQLGEKQQQLDVVLGEKRILMGGVKDLEKRNGKMLNLEEEIRALRNYLCDKKREERGLVNDMEKLKGNIGFLRQENAKLKGAVEELSDQLEEKENALEEKGVVPLAKAAGKNLKTKVVKGTVKTAKWGTGIVALTMAGIVIGRYGFSPEVSSGVSNFYGAGNDVVSTIITNPLFAENNNYHKMNVAVNIAQLDKNAQAAIGKYDNINQSEYDDQRVYGNGSFPGPKPSWVSAIPDYVVSGPAKNETCDIEETPFMMYKASAYVKGKANDIGVAALSTLGSVKNGALDAASDIRDKVLDAASYIEDIISPDQAIQSYQSKFITEPAKQPVGGGVEPSPIVNGTSCRESPFSFETHHVVGQYKSTHNTTPSHGPEGITVQLSVVKEVIVSFDDDLESNVETEISMENINPGANKHQLPKNAPTDSAEQSNNEASSPKAPSSKIDIPSIVTGASQHSTPSPEDAPASNIISPKANKYTIPNQGTFVDSVYIESLIKPINQHFVSRSPRG
jgi:predicted  nucleic acid-binding Zn-ribbon protein